MSEIGNASQTTLEKLYWSVSQIVSRRTEQFTPSQLQNYLYRTPTTNSTQTAGSEIENSPLQSQTSLTKSPLNSETSSPPPETTLTPLPTSNLCSCPCCLRERELRWQLFLIQEQRSNPTPHNTTNSTFFTHHSTPPLPPQQSSYLHTLTSKTVSTLIQLAHTTYPHLKSTLQGLLAYEAKYKLLERFIRGILLLLTWLYQVIFLGIIRSILLLLRKTKLTRGSKPSLGLPVLLETIEEGEEDEGGDDNVGCQEDTNYEEEEGKEQKTQMMDLDHLKQWFMSSAAQLVSGTCEGVELGLSACRRRNLSARQAPF